MADVVYINFEDGLKRVMNNKGLFVKLLRKFIDDNSMTELDAALAEKDLEKAKTVIHTLKGVAGNLSFTELAAKSLELEMQLKAGEASPELVELVKKVYSVTKDEAEKVIAQNG